MEPPPVFLVTLEAVAGAACAEPEGACHPVLAFAQAPFESEAIAAAAAELERLGWTRVRALRTGEVVDAGALPEDFRSAYATALRFGCALIIYDPE